MKQLIILSQAPLTPQIKRNSYLEGFINAGYTNTEFWDISQYIHPGIKLVDELSDDCIRYIPTVKELSDSIDKINTKNVVFILDFAQTWETKEIFRLLSDKNCIYVRIDMYANTYLYVSKWSQLSKLLTKDFFKILMTKLRSIRYHLYAKRHHIRPFIRYYSSSSLAKVDRTDKINHPDYEELKFSTPHRILKEHYILFVDTYFGYHPDDIYIHHYKKQTSPQKYHESLIRFFSYLEKQYEMPVVIAAHPKSNYTPDTFGNRKIIKYHTKDLVLFADKVILQLCNTISWVSLSNKPLVLVTTNGYEMFSKRRKGLRMLGTTLGLTTYNIDNCDFDKIKFCHIDFAKRERYIYTYLTDKEVENTKNIDILSKSFESL